MAEANCRIDIANAPEFRLGTLLARPPLRTLARDDGAEEVIEPRVMQVLIALAEAHGGVVTRDALIARCWEGRVVGEDAINRVISRLRRTARSIGDGAFRIETVNKVGYRLVPGEGAGERGRIALPRLSRRMLIASGGAAIVAAGAAGMLLFPRGGAARAVPGEVAPLIDQAMAGMRSDSFGGTNLAIANLRHAVDLKPGYADGWGLLACAYSQAMYWRPSSFAPAFAARANQAAARAEALDPGNGLGRAARALLMRRQGNWLAVEQGLRAAIEQQPHNDVLLATLAKMMIAVGRCAEAVTLSDQAVKSAPPAPRTLNTRVQALWAAGRLEEAYQASDEVYALWPIDLAVWFTRFYLLAHSGRSAEALAMAANRDGRPRGVPDYGFDVVTVAVSARASGKPAAIDEAMRIGLEASRRGAGYAENAMQFAANLGRVDTAFEIAEAYYFARGFSTGERRFVGETSYTPQNDRQTQMLFLPSTARMRGDPRFARLAGELGLDRYWREAGVAPDYRRG